MSDQKTYEFNLPYFKQGSDLEWFLKDHSPAEALRLHAEMMEHAANKLRRLANVAAETPGLSIEADAHMILVTGPPAVLDGLLGEEESALLCRWGDTDDCEDDGWDDSDTTQ